MVIVWWLVLVPVLLLVRTSLSAGEGVGLGVAVSLGLRCSVLLHLCPTPFLSRRIPRLPWTSLMSMLKCPERLLMAVKFAVPMTLRTLPSCLPGNNASS